MITTADIAERFGHKPGAMSDEQVDNKEVIKNLCAQLALDIIIRVPEGREQAVAITKLEEVQMWANAGIARNK